MLIQSLLAMKSRHALVRDTYRKSIRSTREFMHICKQRAIEVSPDQKALLLNCFYRISCSINERYALSI
jgi:hypothetical protein